MSNSRGTYTEEDKHIIAIIIWISMSGSALLYTLL